MIAGAAYTVNPKPANFEEIQVKLGEIPEYLDNGEYCGGWNRNESVGEKVGEGKVALVEGLPGRSGQPLGAIRTGMAKRDEMMQFPESAIGLSTACDMEQGGLITKTVWSDASNGKVQRQFQHPDFDDPPCLDRSEDPTNQPTDSPPGTYKEEPPHTEERCQEFCEWVNKFVYRDCKVMEVQLDDECKPITAGGKAVKKCVQWEDRYTCTDSWVNGGGVQETVEFCVPPPPPEASRVGRDAAVIAMVPPPAFGGHEIGHVDPGGTESAPNCVPCAGGDCRCKAPAGMQCSLKADKAGGNGRPYESFFRQYLDTTYTRAAVPDVPGDRASNTADVACYGFYEEFDPKTRQTKEKDRRCMIDIDVSEYPDTQKGKGTIEMAGVVDPDPSQPGQQRGSGAYDQNEDLWYRKLGRAFSFVNEKVFRERYDKDLTSVYLDADNLDRGELRASWQFSEQKPVAQSAYVRAFDDTGENRTIVRWWQKQQTEAASLFHRPVIRMLLPSSWAYGIDVNDPLFRGNEPLRELTPSEARSRSIEIQIQADEEVLGAVLNYLERSLVLPVRETPVPIVLPLGSPTEFRAAAQAWCSWWIRKTGEPNCDGAPGEVQDVMDRLDEYADQIENVRMLRSALAMYAGAILEMQHDMSKPLSEWISQHVDVYRQIIDEQKYIADQMAPAWTEVQEAYLRYERVTNMPWCMNQRFTLPIYSLLDDWLPARKADASIYADAVLQDNQEIDAQTKLPDLSQIEIRPRDISIDLRSVAYMTGSLVIPVLKPVQVRLTLPKPPSPEEDHGLTGDELPALPGVDATLALVVASIAELPKVESTLTVQPPSPPDPLGGEKLKLLAATLQQLKETVTKMDETYGEFWDSLTAFDGGQPPTCETSAQSVDLKPLECCSWDAFPCVHVEMDLVERVTRIASRPLVHLKDDYLAVGEPKYEGAVCLPQDHACDIVNPQRASPGVRWEVAGDVSNEQAAEELRTVLRVLSLPEDVGVVPPDKLPPYDIAKPDLLPPFDLPHDIGLPPGSTP